MNPRITTAMMALIMLMTPCAASAQGVETNWEYHNPTGDQFPIMTSGLCPYPNHLTALDLVRIEECGFNLVQTREDFGTPEYVAGLAAGTDLKLDVQVPTMYFNDPAKFAEYVAKWDDMPQVAMFDFGDEIDMKRMREQICLDYDTVRKMGVSQLPIFNRAIFDTKKIDGKDYGVPQELEDLQQLFHPAVWCYDYYPVFQIYSADAQSGEMTPHGKPYVNGGMYRWLQYYRDISQATGRPFWYYTLCLEYESPMKDKDGNPTGQWLRRPVTEDYMRFATFSALAYGAKGLRFWTYSMFEAKAFRSIQAPVDINDQPTEIWYAMRKVISEVRRHNDLFLNSEVRHVYHSGSRRFADTAPQPIAVGPFRTLESDPEYGVLTSLMTCKGKRYLMVVNHDINNPQKVHATAGAGIRIKDISSGSKKFQKKSSYDFTLSPGGYLILEYNRDDPSFRP